MKIKHIFTTFGLAIAAIGIGAGFAGKGQVKEAKAAAPGYTTVYLSLGSCNWESKENAKIYVHWWGSSTASSASSSTNQMTKNSFALYTFDVPSDATGMIFDVNGWGGDCQTVDLVPDTSKPLWTITTSYTNGTKQNASSQAYSEKTIYVLDKSNNRLQVNHYAHAWSSSNTKITTTWPGISMAVHSGRIYKVVIPSVVDTIIWHNNEGNQTADLSIDGVCSVLESDWNGSKWVSLEAAQFIDGYMKFNEYGSDQRTTPGKTEDCDANYAAAKAAYNALSSNTVRKEVLGVNEVKARLGNWADAHGDTLDNDGAQLAGDRALSTVIGNDSNTTLLIVIISSMAIISALGLFLLKRKQDR